VKHIQFSPFLRSREHVSEQLAILASMPQAVIQRLKDRDMQCNCGMLGVLLEERSQRVLYVTEVSRFYLQLPVWQCPDITCPFHQGFTLSPQQLDIKARQVRHESSRSWVLLFDMLVERGIAEERIRELVARRLAAEAIARAEGGNQAPPLPWQAQYAIYRLRQIYSTPDHFALPLPDAALIWYTLPVLVYLLRSHIFQLYIIVHV
jgi:hypothetical protein